MMHNELSLEQIRDKAEVSHDTLTANGINAFVVALANQVWEDGEMEGVMNRVIENWGPGDNTTGSTEWFVNKDGFEFRIDIEYSLGVNYYARNEREVGLGGKGEIESVEFESMEIQMVEFCFCENTFVIEDNVFRAKLLKEAWSL